MMTVAAEEGVADLAIFAVQSISGYVGRNIWRHSDCSLCENNIRNRLLLIQPEIFTEYAGVI